MKYLIAIGGVLLFQVVFTYAITQASTGGGSFVGLGAMLMAVMGIPFTTLFNFLTLRANDNKPVSASIVPLVFVSLSLPAAQLALMIVVSVFRL